MGGTSKTTQQTTSSTTPYANSTPVINGILGNVGNVNPNLTGAETGALDTLSANGQAGNSFAPAIGGVANTLLGGGGPDRTGMVNDAYAQYQNTLNPIASGQFVDPSTNPELQKYLQVARDDAANSINAQFAGAGRDLSGLNQQSVARGIGQAEAPILYDAYNQGRTQQIGAANSLYGAGNTTAGLLSNLDQTKLGNQAAGIGAADAAVTAQNQGPMQVLQAEAQRRGIPLQTMAQMMGVTLPVATAFGTTNGTATGTSTMSPVQQALAYSQMFHNLFAGGGNNTATPPVSF